jgi:hypothetical protein
MKNFETMNVGELKKFLNQFPDDQPTGFAYPSGDYWHTTLVSGITQANVFTVAYTDYHRSFKLANPELRGMEGTEVLILS